MKKGLKFLFASTAIALGLGAAAAGLSFNKTTESVSADATETILIELGDNCNWNDKAGDNFCKLSIYFYGGASGNVWGGVISMDGHHFYEYTYSANSYTSMIVVRLNPSANVGNWDDKYNQSVDLGKSSSVTIHDEKGEGTYYATANSHNIDAVSLTDDLSGTSFDIIARDRNPAGHLSLCASGVSVNVGDKFKVTQGSDEYTNLNSGISSTEFDTTSNPGYITSKVKGNYDFYFDADNHELWVEENAEQAALEFAQDFNTAMSGPCADEDADNKTAVSAIWSTWKDHFESLTIGAKQAFGSSNDKDIVQARSNYIHCVDRYNLATWDGAPSAAYRTSISPIIENNSSVIVVVASVLLLASAGVGGYFLLRKREER